MGHYWKVLQQQMVQYFINYCSISNPQNLLQDSEHCKNERAVPELERPDNAVVSIADEDEDGQDFIVNDDSILAEVKFAQRCRESA